MAEHPEQPPDRTGAETSPADEPAARPPAADESAASERAQPPQGRHATPGTSSQQLGSRLPKPDSGARAVNFIATLVAVATGVVVSVLAIHILFVVFEANEENGIVTAIRDWAETLAWGFKDIFTPEDAKVGVAVNFGVAAVAYLIIGRVVVRLLRRFG